MAQPYFRDTSARIKRYLKESGSVYMQDLCDGRNEQISLLIAQITLGEIVATLQRAAEREGFAAINPTIEAGIAQ